MKFTNGKTVNTLNEVKYLGCMINDKGNPKREVRKRVSECMCTMKKLDIFWKHTNNPKEWKIIVFNAIIRTKLIYGLESAQLNESVNKYLNVFQLKVLRKILELDHTYVDRGNTNEKIYEETEEEMNRGNTGRRKPLMKISEYYDSQRRKLVSQLIHHKETDDPRIEMTFNKDTLQINEYSTKRIGRPKFAWWTFALDELWLTCQKANNENRYTTMNLGNPEHIEHLKQTAKSNYEEHEKRKQTIRRNDNNKSNNSTRTGDTPNTEMQPQTNLINTHTPTEEHNARHAATTTATQRNDETHEFPEFDALETTETFKQILEQHKAHNREIINTQFKRTNNCVNK